MTSLPWIIIYVILGVAVLMHILSWTPIYRKVTPVFYEKDKKLGVIAQTAGYWMRVYPADKQVQRHAVEHEFVHIRQNWRYTWLVVALLRISKKMRVRFELPAYAAGFRAGRDLTESASAMIKDLKLDMSLPEAKKAILEHAD